MINIGITSVTIILILCSTVASFYLLFLLFREKGIGHAVLGFFVFPYAIVWGWINAKRLEIIDIMAFGTIMTIFAIAFPTIIGAQRAAQFVTQTIESEGFETVVNEDGSISITSNSDFTFSSSTPISMGSISVGGTVTGQLDSIMDVHEWTFNGSRGQTVTIRTNGNGTDTRIDLLGPDGTILVSDDDSGENSNALISSFSLPADGQYKIQVDGFSSGSYDLSLN